MRVLEGNSPEGTLRNRIARADAILSKAEKMVDLAAAHAAKGDLGSAKILKRRAHDETRMAMRLIGILVIEFNLDMNGPIARARRIVALTKNGNGHAGGNGTVVPVTGVVAGR